MKLLFIQTCAPHGSINAQEGLDAVLMGSAFSTCTLLFQGEGVLQLISNQAPDGLGVKDFSRTFGALRDYGVTDIYCQQSAMDRFRITEEDLLLDVKVLADSDIKAVMATHDRILTF